MDSERVLAGDSPAASPSVSRRGVLAAALGAAALAVPGSRPALAQDEPEPTIRVFPRPNSVTANPGTQITFRGEGIDRLSPIKVSASLSGEHSGIEVRHSDGNGVSFYPDVAFQPGETIVVDTRLGVVGGESGAFQFACCIPRYIETNPVDNPADAAIDVDLEANSVRYRSRPGLVPSKVVLESYGGETAPGYLFLAPKGGKGSDGAMILDDAGEVVWYFPAVVSTERIYDFKVIQFRGEPALVWWQGIAYIGHGFGHWIVANRAYEPIASVQVANGYPGGDMHDIVVTERGTALVITYSTVAWDLTEIDGPEDGNLTDSVVQEIDLETGAVVFEWHSLDHIPIAETYLQYDPEFPNRFIDYVHANALAIDAEGNLIVTARNSWAAYKVDRVSGDVVWRYGGKASSFEMGEGTELAWPHDARPTEDGGLTIFDNGAAPPVHEESRGLFVSLDTDGMTATLTKAYTHPASVLADSQGNVQSLPNGNVLVGWGGAPLASEFAADGTLLLDIRLPEDKESYRAFRFEWDGQPNDQPALAIEPTPDGVAVFATWNGATAVAAWRALAGDTEDALASASDDVPRGGFETEISVTAAGRLIAVEALNAAGEPIGRSRAVARDQ